MLFNTEINSNRRKTLTTVSGSGILMPLKNGFLEKISTCRGKRSPMPETKYMIQTDVFFAFQHQWFSKFSNRVYNVTI